MFNLFLTPPISRTFTCDQCMGSTAFPIIIDDKTFCEACYEYRGKASMWYAPPPKAKVCDCGAEKSQALGHYEWCDTKSNRR